jgi:endosialidase-like protein
MSSCFGQDAPQAPDPRVTAAAQTGTNVSTAVANAQLNRVNQVTPEGSLTYENTGNFPWTDPSTGQTYQIPLSTATQRLSPNEQHLYDQNFYTRSNLGALAMNQSGMLMNLLGQPVGTGGAPGAPDVANWLMGVPAADEGYANVGSQQRTFGDAGPITRDYGSDGSLQRDRVEQAMYARLAPQLEQDRQRMEARLRDQGNIAGGAAAENEYDRFNRQLTDTRLGITAAGGQEQKLQADIAAQRAGFQNAAQRQAFEQAQARGTFYNAAQQQDYTQEALRGQFKNAARAQNQARAQSLFGAQNQLRAQYLNELYTQRNQPINEITALLSGSQVQSPNFVNVAAANIPTTDYAGLVNNKFNQDFSNYQQQSQNFNQIMGGIFGAVAGLTRSDKREKNVGPKLGTVFAAGHDGEKPLPVYEYAYKDDPAQTPRVGPMAQDVQKIDPKAVKTIRGTKYIDRTRLGSILKVA